MSEIHENKSKLINRLFKFNRGIGAILKTIFMTIIVSVFSHFVGHSILFAWDKGVIEIKASLVLDYKNMIAKDCPAYMHVFDHWCADIPIRDFLPLCRPDVFQ